MIDRDEFEETWKQNEVELNRLYSIKTAARELFAPKIEELERVQDRIEYYLGLEDVPPGSVRYSGMP